MESWKAGKLAQPLWHDPAAWSAHRSWEAVEIPRRLRKAGVLTAGGLVAFGVILAFVPWTQTISAIGQISAYAPQARPQDLEAQIAGRIVRWHVLEGETVRQGDPIVELEDVDPNFLAPDLLELLERSKQAAEENRQAALNRTRQLAHRIQQLRTLGEAAVPSAQARVRESEDRIREARQRVAAAQVTSQTAELNLRRHRQLAEQGLVSQRDVELAVQIAVSSRADLEGAKFALKQVEHATRALGFGREQIGAEVAQRLTDAEAEHAAALAEAARAAEQLAAVELRLANAEQRRKASRVVAPLDGVVVRMARVGPGETVRPGDRLVRISPTTSDQAVELWANGNDAPLLAAGRKVRLLFEGFPAIPIPSWPELMTGTYGGRIKVVDQVDDGEGTFRFWVVPDPLDRPWPDPRSLRQGSRVKAWVILDRVPLWYEMWRRFNLFPPGYDADTVQPGKLETILPKAGKRGK